MAATNAKATESFLPHKKHLTLVEKVNYFQHSVKREQSLVQWFDMVHKNLHRDVRTIVRRYDFSVRVWKELRFHKAVLKWHESLLRHYRQKIQVQTLPRHYSAWMCIHRYEGSWTDAGSPYYGGLQMDWDFMTSYGDSLLKAKGPANNWTPLEQMWVAERAFESGRGFYPWPQTARYCGLI